MTTGQTPDPIPDLEPFRIDPIILARLNQRNVRSWVATVVLAIGVMIGVSWTALLSGLFFQPQVRSSWWSDLVSFVLRRQGDPDYGTVPYLRDYPSIVLTITITVSVGLVYGLYRNAAELHSEMERSRCLRYTTNGKDSLKKAINEINVKFARWGRFSPIALILAFCFTLGVNLLLQSRLFDFLAQPGLYDNWWASLRPLRVGGILWLLLGTIGIYMVYAEAVLGLTFVKFLRKCGGDYQFRANMLNPDGLYGWSKPRQIVSNMEFGVLCTLFSCWAMSFFMQPAIGSLASAIVILVFSGIVMYVFVHVTVGFRKHVRTDKKLLRAEIETQIVTDEQIGDPASMMRILVGYQKLDLVGKIPSTPIRQRWLVAGAFSILGPLLAIVLQVVKYFTSVR